jgi:ankyrin repeat protein
LCRPLAKTDNSTRNKAFDNLLQGGLDKEAEEDIRCLTAASDWIEEQNFSKLHKIIVGFLLLDLEKEIADDPSQIDVTDAMGRTPLLWAAARGDHESIRILLDHDADPNIMDMYLAPPVSYAADRGHTLCVKLLLEAGAFAEPKLPSGVKLGSPLNCAARNTKDPLLLKYLLTYGAEVDGTGVDGNTSLIHASRTDNVRFAILLLDYNANINATSITQHTPLTTAITYNSHGVLRLLLERWEEFSTCPRLQGPHLLEITALYADVETVQILAETDHFKLKYDEKYSVRDFAKCLTDRVDVTDELLQAFDKLLLVINENPERRKSRENLMEAGLLPHPPSTLAALYESEKAASDAHQSKEGSECKYSDDSDEEAEFEDAVEGLEALDLDAEDIGELATSCPAGFFLVGLD